MLKLTFTRYEPKQEKAAIARLTSRGWALESRTGQAVIKLRFRRTLNKK